MRPEYAGTIGEACCTAGEVVCAGHAQKIVLICDPASMNWMALQACSGQTLCDSEPGMNQGTCQDVVAACMGREPGAKVCEGIVAVECGPDLVTSEETTCMNACQGGECVGVCTPGGKQCKGLVPQTCDTSGQWEDGSPCPYVCFAGACTGVCVPGTKQCSGQVLQTCDASGQWQSGTSYECEEWFALRFDGVDDIVTSEQSSVLMSATSLGLLLDFTTSDSMTDWAIAASQGGYATETQKSRWTVGFEPHNSIGLSLYLSDGSTQTAFTDLLSLDDCYPYVRFQLLVTVDIVAHSTKLIRYENGTETLLLNDHTPIAPLNTANLYPLRIGNASEGTYQSAMFKGAFRQLAVFNYSDFTAADRQVLFSEPYKLKDYVANGVDHGFSFEQSDVIDYFEFGVGSGNVLPNLCANANADGILKNFSNDDSQWVKE